MTRNFIPPLVQIKNNLTAEKYKEILEENLLPFAKEKMGPDWYFQQDGDPKHRSQLMMGVVRRLPYGKKLRLPGWFSLNKITLLKTPPYSPDVNPIEHLWAFVKCQLREKRFTSKDELWMNVQK
eukprot:gene23726-28447_t